MHSIYFTMLCICTLPSTQDLMTARLIFMQVSFKLSSPWLCFFSTLHFVALSLFVVDVVHTALAVVHLCTFSELQKIIQDSVFHMYKPHFLRSQQFSVERISLSHSKLCTSSLIAFCRGKKGKLNGKLHLLKR